MENDEILRFEPMNKRISALKAKIYSKEKKPTAAIIRVEKKLQYKPGSTVAKLVDLLNAGGFDTHKTLNEVAMQFAAKDYHFKLSDLTLPVRKLVRHGLLRREKISGKWAYIKV